MKGKTLRIVMTLAVMVGMATGAFGQEPTAEGESIGAKRVMLLMGGAYHDFKRNTESLVEAFEGGGQVDVVTTMGKSWLTEEKLGEFEAVVIYTQGGRLSEAEERALLKAVGGGKGLVVIHEAVTSFADNAGYQTMVGGQAKRKLTMRDLTAIVVGEGPIVAGLPKSFEIKDEILPRPGLAESGAKVWIEATADDGETVYPVVWTRTQGRGRVFVTTLGHGKLAVEHEAFQGLIRAGLEWALGGKK